VSELIIFVQEVGSSILAFTFLIVLFLSLWLDLT